jgi:hypothetical protein
VDTAQNETSINAELRTDNKDAYNLPSRKTGSDQIPIFLPSATQGTRNIEAESQVCSNTLWGGRDGDGLDTSWETQGCFDNDLSDNVDLTGGGASGATNREVEAAIGSLAEEHLRKGVRKADTERLVESIVSL